MADNFSDRVFYLHGDLDLHIIEARSLPNSDVLIGHIRRCITFEACRNPSHAGPDRKVGHRGPKIITSDPYVKVSVLQATLARTRILPSSQNPRWDERFHVPIAHPLVNLEFQVKDNDVFSADLLGTLLIPAEKIASAELISGWFPLLNGQGKPHKPDTALHLEMKFTPCDKNPLYKHGIADDPQHLGVRDTYFPLRKGSHVTLYQDAHVRPECKLPEIELDGGKVFQHDSCWEDICHAISEAHHMIYICGWSVFHKVKLIREPTRPLPRGGDLTLGELLKYKSEEGVRVLLLVWDDNTSHSKFFLKTVSDSQKFQRFMIYVHAKGMIVDDEYVIVGSANINQRSLAGTKDTEIAMGSYQPHHTWAVKNRHPHGQVYGYRMSLWNEHLGKLESCFKEPETLECVRTVNEIAEDNWKRYTSENFTSLQGHLLRYPLKVDVDGKVDLLPGHENFPDVGGKVIGAHSPTMPDILTT